MRRIATPDHTDNDDDNENVKQHERQTFGHVDKYSVVPERTGNLRNWDAMFFCDLVKQGFHALISCSIVGLVGYVVWGSQPMMNVGVADCQIFGKLCVFAEMLPGC